MGIMYWSSDVCSSDLRMDERLAEAFVGRFELKRALTSARDVDIGADAELVRARPLRRQLRPQDNARALFAVLVAFLAVRRNGDSGERDEEQGGKLMALGHAKSLLFRMKFPAVAFRRSEEHTSEIQSLMRISYDGFCLK